VQTYGRSVTALVAPRRGIAECRDFKPLAKNALQHRILVVKGPFLVKVHAGVGVKQHAAHKYDYIDVGILGRSKKFVAWAGRILNPL
jgi:hypothetical protein